MDYRSGIRNTLIEVKKVEFLTLDDMVMDMAYNSANNEKRRKLL